MYDRFRSERERPLLDLLGRVRPAPGGRAADLGCGTGRGTVLLHQRVQAASTVGIDSSPTMLAEAERLDPVAGVRFVLGDLLAIEGGFDVLFANASLQWLPDQFAALGVLADHLVSGGQLAVQVPANFSHPSHTVADAIGVRYGLEPLARDLGAHAPADYASHLWRLGLRDIEVDLHVYGMELERTEQVLDWVAGTLLTRFERELGPERFAAFERDYRAELLAALGDPTGEQPYYYAFPRILFTACRPSPGHRPYSS